eukprot:gene27184-2425_t
MIANGKMDRAVLGRQTSKAGRVMGVKSSSAVSQPPVSRPFTRSHVPSRPVPYPDALGNLLMATVLILWNWDSAFGSQSLEVAFLADSRRALRSQPPTTAAPTIAVARNSHIARSAGVAAPATAVVVENPTVPNKATITRDIVFVTSEVTPWSKTGGLADVLNSLPVSLAARGHRVMVVSPNYGGEQFAGAEECGVSVNLGIHDSVVRYKHEYSKGVDWVFVDHKSFPRPGGIYADKFGAYGDNQYRFTLLSLAAMEAPLHLELNGLGKYGQDCVFVANDWHAALVPVYLAAKYRPNGTYKNARSIMAIHNMSHQGVSSPTTFDTMGFPKDWVSALPPPSAPWAYLKTGCSSTTFDTMGLPQDWVFFHHLQHHGPSSGLGVCSPTTFGTMGFSKDWYGAGVRSPTTFGTMGFPKDWYGAGVSSPTSYDTMGLSKDWYGAGVSSPTTFDTMGLPKDWYGAMEWQYPPHQRLGAYEEEGRCMNYMKGGLACADRIMTVSAGYADEIKTYVGGWGLHEVLSSRQYVLNGVVNGIDTEEWNPAKDPYLPANYDINDMSGKKKCKAEMQKELGLPKGADILLEAAPEILKRGEAQLVCLGAGAKDLEDGLRWLEGTYKDKARGWVGFNVPFSHRLTAAADILLMPSRFEPCGLNQLYAMRYGTVPVAHKTGGLKDTVIDFDPWNKKGTGWTYTECDAKSLTFSVLTALRTYRENPECFKDLQRRGMERDASWDTAAQQYEQVFTWAKIRCRYFLCPQLPACLKNKAGNTSAELSWSDPSVPSSFSTWLPPEKMSDFVAAIPSPLAELSTTSPADLLIGDMASSC